MYDEAIKIDPKYVYSYYSKGLLLILWIGILLNSL